MALLEIELSNTKIKNLFEEMINESYDHNEIDKLMRFTLKMGNEWGGNSIQFNTLKRMRKFCDDAMAEMEEGY